MKKIFLSVSLLSLVFFTGCTVPTKKTTATTSPVAQESATSTDSLFDMNQNILALESSISTNYKKSIELIQALTKTNVAFCNLIIESTPGRNLEYANQKFLFESASMKDYYLAVNFDPAEQRKTREFIIKKDVPEIKCTKLTSPTTQVSYAKAYYKLAETQDATDLDQSGLTEKIKIYITDPNWKIEFWGNNLKNPEQALLTRLIDYESGQIDIVQTASPTVSPTTSAISSGF